MNKPVRRVIEIEASDSAPLQRVQPALDRLIAEQLAEFNKRGRHWSAATEEPRRCSSFDLYNRGAVYWRVVVTFVPDDG